MTEEEQCNECNNDNLMTDQRTGDVICPLCGLVQNDEPMLAQNVPAQVLNWRKKQ